MRPWFTLKLLALWRSSPAIPDPSRLTVAAAALSLVSAPLASRTGAVAVSREGAPGFAPDPGTGPRTGVAPGPASRDALGTIGLPFESIVSLALGSMIGRAISADFSGVTRMSCFSWPYRASASASASAQVCPLRRQEQLGS